MDENATKVLKMLCQPNKVLRFLWIYQYLIGLYGINHEEVESQTTFTEYIKSTMPLIPTVATRDQKKLNKNPNCKEDMFTYIRNTIGHPNVFDVSSFDMEIPSIDVYLPQLEEMAINTM